MAKLRYLRTVEERRRGRVRVVAWAVKIAAIGFVLSFSNPDARVKATGPATRLPAGRGREHAPATVWLVEEAGGQRVYSNGLQVRTLFATQSKPRRYRTYSRPGLKISLVESRPAGIVFHTTESLIVPMDPSLNRALTSTREAVLEHVRRDRLYNFLIDRFGQVYAVVPEDQSAFHAGHSVWADRERVYVDLNESFIGVSFEAQTGSSFAPSAAQLHAGRLLTAMLRSRYGIADENCVTHAQVSVNPDNMRLGYHTDWASTFPFHELGLESGYSSPVPAVNVFGFIYDDNFLEAIGGRAWDGLAAAEDQIVREAAEHRVTASEYRKILQKHYQELRRHHERAG